MSEFGLAEQRPPAPLPPTRSNRVAVIRLAVVVAVGIAVAVIFHGLAVLVVILSLIAMVMLHELGHFMVAKASGMKVTEYFLGFGPRLWSVRRRETEYGVKAIPAGGYVRIVGMTNLEEVPPEDEPRSYRQATFPRRLAVGLAGSAMHFVIAFVLLWSIFAFSGYPVATAVTSKIASVASFAQARSPAEKAGLRAGDVITAVNGHPVRSEASLRKTIEANARTTLRLTVLRNGKSLVLAITPAPAGAVRILGPNNVPERFPGASAHEGVIGVNFATTTIDQTWNPAVAVWKAGASLGSLTKATALGIGQVFSAHGLGNFIHQVATANSSHTSAPAGRASGGGSSSSSNGEFLSTVGAAEVAVQAAHEGVTPLLLILVLINLFIGMVNLFPMLPLDGGHVLIACYERVRSRRGRPYHADVAKLMPVAYLFLAVIVLIGLGALYLNLLRPPTLG